MSAQEYTNEKAITAELPMDYPDNPYISDPGSLMAVDIASATHEGYQRHNNEDHYLVIRFRRSLETLNTNLDDRMLPPNYDLSGYGLLVADGLGGMAAGEVASSTALVKLVELVMDTPDWIMGLKEKEHAETVLQRMTDRFLMIDENLKELSERDLTLSGMGTTLTVAAILENDLVIGHVGDSRAYLFRANSLSQLTKDHTLAQALIDAGIVGREEPASRSMRHVLTAALGSSVARLTPEVRHLRLNSNDQLLLCTDGLTEMVDDKTIASLLRNAETAAAACKNLITAALAAGGFDNITVVLARFAPTNSREAA